MSKDEGVCVCGHPHAAHNWREDDCCGQQQCESDRCNCMIYHTIPTPPHIQKQVADWLNGKTEAPDLNALADEADAYRKRKRAAKKHRDQ